MENLKKKRNLIPLGIIILLILMVSAPKLAATIIVLGALGAGVYLYTKSEKFKAYNKFVKSLITTGLILLFIFGMVGLNSNPQATQQQKLAAEKGKIEKQETDKKAKEEQAKKDAEDKAKKEAQEVAKKKEAEEATKKKAEQEAAVKKAEQDKAKALAESQQNNQQAENNSASNNAGSSSNVTSTQSNSGSGTVYWVPKGKSYHSTTGCPTLARSKNIQQGPLSECPKSDPCDKCAH